MTPRERVRTALGHSEPDRVPVDNNGLVSSIHEAAYGNLLRHLGRTEDVVILDPVQRIVLSSEEVMRTLGVDTRYLYPNAPSTWHYRENPDGTWKDEFGTVFRRVGLYADAVGPVLRDKSLAEVKAYKPPDPVHPSRFTGVREKARGLYESTDWSLAAGPIFCLDYMRWVLRGLELSAVAAAVIGGTALSGGIGSVAGVFWGAMAIALIENGLVMLRIPYWWTFTVFGGIIILSVIVSKIIEVRRAAAGGAC